MCQSREAGSNTCLVGHTYVTMARIEIVEHIRHPHPSFRDMNCEVSCLAHKMRFWAKCLCPSRLIYGSYKPQCNGILGAAFGKQLV